MKSEYQELICLTKLYLLQEHSAKDWKFCEQETFEFFKNQVQKEKISPQIQKKEPLQLKQPKVEKQSITKIKENLQQPITKFEEIAQPIVKEESKEIPLETPKPIESTDFSDIKTFMQKRSIPILLNPPDDSEAKNHALQKKQKPVVMILSFDKLIHPFLKNMETAINLEFTSACVQSAQRIENENSWEDILKQQQLKLIIASGVGLYSLQNLMRYYREISKKAHYFLGNIPLLLLTDLSSYLKEPKLKPALWQQICQHLKGS